MNPTDVYLYLTAKFQVFTVSYRARLFLVNGLRRG